jgi:hypothetical protein
MRTWAILLVLALPCFGEPTTKESKVVMDLKAEIERLRKEVATLRAELAKIRGTLPNGEARQGMKVEAVRAVMAAGGWDLRQESDKRQLWRKEDGDFYLYSEIWYEGGVVEEVIRSRSKQ